MAYLDSGAELAALAALPLDSSQRNVSTALVAARLRSERGLIEGGLAGAAGGIELLAIVLVERFPDEALSQSICSLALQSHPAVRCALVPMGRADRETLRRFAAGVAPRPASLEVWPDLEGERRAELARAAYVTFLRHGDRLHPSAAAWLCIERSAGRAADVLAWGEFQPDGAGGTAWAQRNPALHRISLLHLPYLRNAFAVAGSLAAGYAGDLVREAARNDLHLFQIHLSRRDGVRWQCHPEYFLIRADARAREHPEGAARRAYDADPGAYAALFEKDFPELAFRAAPRDDAAPYRLAPRRVPGSLSVIIPFRDKPELTARAVRSIAAQGFPGSLEIVLVNNQSGSDALEALRAALGRLPRLQWKIADYDAPFNHSAQCALGVRESGGEVLLFMNNDAELSGKGALEELAAWAAWPGVASVGGALEDPRTQKAAAGMEARLSAPHHLDSIVEEHSDPALTPFVREVFGNSFAFAAVSREAFGKLGGLDALRFPNGYNDVEFACRTRRAGCVHVALGHVRVRHATGQSRARTDETVQRTLLRTLYPEFAAAALTELRFDESMRHKPSAARPKAEAGGAAQGDTPPGNGALRRLALAPAALLAAAFSRGRFRGSKEQRDALRLVEGSSLFDREWYLAQNPDVAREGIDPALHYLLHGAAEDRDPGPGFSSRWYLTKHKDVARAGINPLVHYLRHGKAEAREITQSASAPAVPTAHSARIEPADEAAAPLSLPRAPAASASWVRHADLAAPSGHDWKIFSQVVISLEHSATALADVWYVNDRDLRVRFTTGSNASDACVARFFQYPPAGGDLVLAGETLLSGQGTGFADAVLVNPYLPVLMTLVAPQGRLLAASLLPFPSLCRGGIHYGELCAVAGGTGYLEALQAASRSLLREMLGTDAAAVFSVGRIEIDLQGASGAERIFSADLREWLATLLHIDVRPATADGPGDAKIRAHLEQALALPASARHAAESIAARERSAALSLTLPANAVPSLHALVSRSLGIRAGEARAVGSFVVAEDASGWPRWAVSVPPLGDELVALQPAGVAIGFPVLARMPGAAQEAGAQESGAPLAVRFRDTRERHAASLVMPFAPDAPGPLLRTKPQRGGDAAAISVIATPDAKGIDAFAAFLESLCAQTLGERVEVIAVVERKHAAGKRAVESALWRFFPERHRLLERGGEASRAAGINRATEGAAGKFLLIAGAGVALHDARTLETLLALADHDRIASAGCMLLRAPQAKHSPVPLLQSGGIFPAARLPATPGAPFSEPDCLGVFGAATYPVAANSCALFMVRADVWRALGGFDPVLDPATGGDIEYGARAIAQGYRHLCTSAVSAELSDATFRAAYTEEASPPVVGAECWPRIAASATLLAALKA